MATRDITAEIEHTISTHKVVLYMKGTPSFPQCGFSGGAVQMLNTCQVAFHAVDVLADDDIRQGIKTFANWPTIPQLYINGEFVGGADIMRELFQSGELQAALAA